MFSYLSLDNAMQGIESVLLIAGTDEDNRIRQHQKLEKIKELQGKGEFVAMTGDGVNDSPALAQVDIGIAVGSGSDIAAETAGIVLVNNNPKDIVSLILSGQQAIMSLPCRSRQVFL
ncbi:P-type E1-E2 ATPase [Mucilaginibacter sp. UYCu711]